MTAPSPEGLNITDELKARFESKFYVTPGCWIWKAGKESQGYGRFSVRRVMKRTHRVSYELYVAQIPPGMHVLHRCDNRLCVNPNHLFLGTNADNIEDKVKKGRQQKGTAFKTAKLDENMVLDIRKDPRTNKEIADEYGIAYTSVSAIKRFKSWKHVLENGVSHE